MKERLKDKMWARLKVEMMESLLGKMLVEDWAVEKEFLKGWPMGKKRDHWMGSRRETLKDHLKENLSEH